MSNAEFEIPKVGGDESLEIPLPKTDEESTPPQEESTEVPVATEENESLKSDSAERSEPNASNDDTVKAISSDVVKLTEQVAGLSKLFETKILHTEHEEKIVDQMHKELQRYKEDMYSQLVRPILLDIIEIRDSILRISSAHHSKPEGEQNVPLKTFEMYASDVQEILEKNSIEIYKSEINTDFVPVRHRAIKKAPTPDESLHGKIAESLSDGYTYMGKTITPEKIVVYYYEPQQSQIEPQNPNNKEEL